jgi:hypothetical protein
MSSGSSELARLARKYDRLIELRRERSESPPDDLRTLAEEFPGALRELDALPLAELERRLSSVRRALEGGPTEALLEWLIAYHSLMRTALAVKRRLGGERRPSSERARLLAEALTSETGVTCSVELVRQVAAPPRGRLNELVLARIAQSSGRAASELRSALFDQSVAP